DDVRVLQVHRHARLVEEHRHELLVLGEVGQNALDRDGFLQAADGALRHTTVDLRHTAGVDSIRDLVSLVFGHPRAAERINHNMGGRLSKRRYSSVPPDISSLPPPISSRDTAPERPACWAWDCSSFSRSSLQSIQKVVTGRARRRL